MRNIYRRKMYDTLSGFLKHAEGETGAVGMKSLQVVFTLKKGLKLEERVPSLWLEDAVHIFQKATQAR